MKIALLLFTAALALPAASIEETIKANLEKFNVAAKAGDAASLNALLRLGIPCLVAASVCGSSEHSEESARQSRSA